MAESNNIDSKQPYIVELESKLSRMEQEILGLKEQSESLQSDLEKFSKAFYASNAWMVISTLSEGVFLDLNDSFARSLGFEREDMLGKTAMELGIWADPEERRFLYHTITENGYIKDFQSTFTRKFGETGVALSSIEALDINGQKCLLTSGIDITERKKAEEALIKSEQKFTTIFYKNNCAMAITRFEDGIIFDINDCAADMLGHKREKLLGKNIKEIGIWGESFKRENFIEQLQRVSSMEFETTYMKQTGDMGIVLAKVNIMELDGIKYALISGADITERKKAELNLKASQDKFSKSFHKSGAMKAIARYKDGVLIDVNESFSSTLGFAREEMIGKTALELGIWADPSEQQEMYERLSKEGVIRDWECKIRTKSGEIGSVVSNVNKIDIEGEDCILVSSNNITMLKQYEREIARLDSLKLIGQMAGSIAHEVRNPMTSIKGFLQLFRQQHKYQEDKESIELMIEELDRVNDIITSFLSLSHKIHIEMKPMNLNDCIIGVLQLIIADALKSDVSVDTRLENVPQIMIDKGEIKQLLLNLTRNAIEAMSSGGTLIVKTYQDHKGINLVVQDAGKGMPPEIMTRIGTPFLTTKEHGTGLGLAVCYSIAERHNAQITVETSSEGTLFKVTFPVVA